MTEKDSGVIDKALQSGWRVVFYRSIFDDPLVRSFFSLLNLAVQPKIDTEQLLSRYYKFTSAFIPVASRISTDGKLSWQNYIINLILTDENLFTQQAEIKRLEEVPSELNKIAQQDLCCLQDLAAVSAAAIKKVISLKVEGYLDIETLPDWEGICLKTDKEKDSAKEQLLVAFYSLSTWGEGLELLSEYYRLNGVGIFSRHHAFRWVHRNGEGALEGIRNPDTIQLHQLYEYEREQDKIIRNTEQFLSGYPANNVLLYGDRGTGKSSTVKALVNRYGKKGLRLIEIQKQDLADFPLIISQLVERPQKFILFVDDLSFSENEGQYRELKALLEGGLEARPKNVLVYATSNRRHLVQENFNDKKMTGYDPDNEDVRFMDTLQEKLSLADRFGITVTFTTPDQKRYLAIVEKLARERGLDIPKEELWQRGLKWEISFNARSARTARQFIDCLEGQLALEKNQNNT